MSLSNLSAGHAARPAASTDHHSDDQQEHAFARPSEELVDLYAIVVIAVPLALFLKWLWP
jgi:hypothetical protein